MDGDDVLVQPSGLDVRILYSAQLNNNSLKIGAQGSLHSSRASIHFHGMPWTAEFWWKVVLPRI